MPSRSDIEAAIRRFKRGERPQNFRNPTSWYVVDRNSKQLLPLKGIWAIANGVPSISFNTSDAIRGMQLLGFDLVRRPPSLEDGRHLEEDEIEDEILANADLNETYKEQLIQARRGQGRYRKELEKIEKHCRITGVSDSRLLRASHMKPWRLAQNSERLDGCNGLLLTPTYDVMFDRGYLTFSDNGSVIVSGEISKTELEKIGFSPNKLPNSAPFSDGQKRYLKFHRKHFGFGR